MLDSIDRAILNALQGNFPISERPFADAAAQLGIAEADLIARIEEMLSRGTLSRFGPMFNADKVGGAFCLCAASVPLERFEEVVRLINAHPEVAHNYERDHELNVWFVLATLRRDRIGELVAEISRETGLTIYEFPKEEEYFVGLRVNVGNDGCSVDAAS